MPLSEEGIIDFGQAQTKDPDYRGMFLVDSLIVRLTALEDYCSTEGCH